MIIDPETALALGDALIRAAELAESINKPVAIVQFGGYVIPTTSFDHEEAILVICPLTGENDNVISMFSNDIGSL